MKSSTEKHINVIVHRFEELDPTPWDLIFSFFGVEGRSGPRAYKIYFRNEDLTEVYVFRAARGTSTDTNVHTGKLTEGIKGVIVVVWHSPNVVGGGYGSSGEIGGGYEITKFIPSFLRMMLTDMAYRPFQRLV